MDELATVEIPGYPDYSATQNGEIISKRFKRPMRLHPNHKGYPMTVLINPSGERKTIAAHRIICIAFKGNPPAKSAQVNHLNGVKMDCRPANLEWATPEENQKHSYVVLGRENRRKRDNLYPNSKLDPLQVSVIRQIQLPSSSLAAYFNVSDRSIRNIKNNATWMS